MLSLPLPLSLSLSLLLLIDFDCVFISIGDRTILVPVDHRTDQAVVIPMVPIITITIIVSMANFLMLSTIVSMFNNFTALPLHIRCRLSIIIALSIGIEHWFNIIIVYGCGWGVLDSTLFGELVQCLIVGRGLWGGFGFGGLLLFLGVGPVFSFIHFIMG